MGDLVFFVVVLSRFVVPLLIPRYPVPAIVAALAIDAVDQTVFAAFDVEPDNYQQYDKALDIFYLSVAYISTLRNWTDGFAFRVGQFLWYYRLIGVLAFEFTDARVLLLIFPNTFEYFFIAYEVVRLCWRPRRLSHSTILGMAAAIWVFVKLPQELWIHVLQLDVTDALSDQAWLGPLVGALLVAASAVAWTKRSRIPSVDWPPSACVDAHPTTVRFEAADLPGDGFRLINHPLIEKIVLIALVSIIFSNILPDETVGPLGLGIGVAALIVLNSIGTLWLLDRGSTWRSAGAQFVAMLLLNSAILLVDRLLLGGNVATGVTGFFLLLISLLATLYDRYRAERMPWSRLARGVRPDPVFAG